MTYPPAWLLHGIEYQECVFGSSFPYTVSVMVQAETAVWPPTDMLKL